MCSRVFFLFSPSKCEKIPSRVSPYNIGVIHMTFGRTWTVEQDIPDRSTDREDVPRHVTTAIYSDVTSLATPGPKTADELHRSYVMKWPDMEAPHTVFASLMK